MTDRLNRQREKYGEEAVRELSKSSVLGYKIKDFEIKQKADLGKKVVSSFIDTEQNTRNNEQLLKIGYNSSRNNI